MYLNRFFGDQVTVEYFDMADPQHREDKQKLLAKVPENRLYYPLVFVDGEPAIAGSAEYYEVLYAVRAALDDDGA